ncbi:uncharacterized protein C8Q71DRAFT_910231 [Rhodofomes roseus]|uniref:Fungal-type protein kinase domain-containing protein n=1 Tax=Rhodofomes roseus TaxID=34475 RepID=A0ABQ8K5P3_9APHY|nr:uncharacterized protein C8Q71DRAFT_910231 [Rhodofomes roseus]KAH9832235.1 hypothetical protein C8Q71DRAFT_910231 [Rhodofomes roseus]
MTVFTTFQSQKPIPSTHTTVSRVDEITKSRPHRWRGIKQQFGDKIIWDVELIKFVEAVWGFGLKDIPMPTFFPSDPSHTTGGHKAYQLRKTMLQDWMYHRGDQRLRKPLINIANDLLDQLCGATTTLECRSRKVPAQFWAHDQDGKEGQSKDALNMGFAVTVDSYQADPRWDFQLAFIKVKKRNAFPIVWRIAGPRLIAIDAATETNKRKRMRSEYNEEDIPEPKRMCTSTARVRERPVKTSSGGKIVKSQPTQKNTTRVLTDHEAQMVQRMNELMSTNVRLFGIGWLVENQHMRLCYGDRFGLVVTKRFKFLDEDRHLFLLAVAAMGQASIYEMGILPDLHFPTNERGEVQFVRYTGAQLRMKAFLPEASAQKDFTFDIETYAQPLYMESGMLSRGTSVLPSVATPGTETYEEFKDEKLVVKISWPHPWQTVEATNVVAVRKALRENKPAYLQHVMDLKCSVTRTIDELDLPRMAMGFRPAAVENRVCCTMVLKRYQKLETLESVDDFKTVYIDVVRAHHWVWQTSRILHQDISTNNIMWFRDAGGRVIGVLCDWDLAKKYTEAASSRSSSCENKAADAAGTSAEDANANKSDEETKSTNTHKDHAGTPPFMATDLLRGYGAAPVHLYRHDLESLFYFLVYFCAGWDPEKRTLNSMPARQWERGTLADIARQKEDFLTDVTAFEFMLAGAHPLLKPLADTQGESWVKRLYAHFSENEFRAFSIRLLRRRLSSTSRFSERGKKYQEELRKLEAEQEGEITYEKFMEALEAPLDV